MKIILQAVAPLRPQPFGLPLRGRAPRSDGLQGHGGGTPFEMTNRDCRSYLKYAVRWSGNGGKPTPPQQPHFTKKEPALSGTNWYVPVVFKGYIKDTRRRDTELAAGWGQIATPLSIETAGGVQKINCASMV